MQQVVIKFKLHALKTTASHKVVIFLARRKNLDLENSRKICSERESCVDNAHLLIEIKATI